MLTFVSAFLLMSSRTRWPPLTVFPFLWLGFAVLGAFSGGVGQRQYFVQVVPPLCLCGAFAVDYFVTMKGSRVRKWLSVTREQLAIALVLVGLLWTSALETGFYRFAKDVFRDTPESADQVVAAYIRDHTDPDTYMYAWCTCAWGYLLADRPASSRYINDHVMGNYMPSQTELSERIRRKCRDCGRRCTTTLGSTAAGV